jgi:hypothetical protein
MISMVIAPSPGWAREWTDSTGRHSVDAEIVEVKDGNVRLKKGGGTSIDVPLTKLSEADRNYAISWQTRQVQLRAIAMVRRLKGHWAFDNKGQERSLVLIDINPYHSSYGPDRHSPYPIAFKRRYPRKPGLKPGDVLPFAPGVERATNSDLADLRGLTTLRIADLSHNNITDAGLENLKGLTSLTTLNLSFTGVTDAGLEHLKGLAKLESLKLDWTGVIRGGVVHRSAWPMSRGSPKTGITDAGLVHLGGLRNLRLLDLSRSDVTDNGVKKLQEALPNCVIKH